MFRRQRPDVLWPIVLDDRTPTGTSVRLRPLGLEDIREIQRIRRLNTDWLRRWDSTSPVRQAPRTPEEVVREYERTARLGESLPFVIEVDGRLVGQLNVTNIVRGAFWSCTAGYWVSRDVAGRWITPTAVAMAGDHAFTRLGLHRLEINIRPENTASLSVVRKLGLREEGLRSRFLHIDGDWRDHLSFAVLAEDVGEKGLMGRLHDFHTRHLSDTPEDLRPRA